MPINNDNQDNQETAGSSAPHAHETTETIADSSAETPKQTPQKLKEQIFEAISHHATDLFKDFKDKVYFNGRRSQIFNFFQNGDVAYSDIEHITEKEHYIPLFSKTLILGPSILEDKKQFENHELHKFLEDANDNGVKAILTDSANESHVILLAPHDEGASELKNRLDIINFNNPLQAYNGTISLITKEDIEFNDEEVLLGKTKLMRKSNLISNNELKIIRDYGKDPLRVLPHENNHDYNLKNEFFVFSSVRDNSDNESVLNINLLELSQSDVENVIYLCENVSNEELVSKNDYPTQKCKIDPNSVDFKSLNTLNPDYKPKASSGVARPSKYNLYNELTNYASYTKVEYKNDEQEK